MSIYVTQTTVALFEPSLRGVVLISFTVRL